jgi:lysyl-tRNA synthetase class 1
MTSVQFDLARSWPFEEARRLAARSGRMDKGHVLFQTGFGPSGLPHIGTFAEVLRTTMVQKAFSLMTGEPTRLVVFSDDMDALRKVPDGLPRREMLEASLGLPLTSVPDPFGTQPSFAAHGNARLRSFLDSFGFDYEFRSATECYRSGMFDEVLLRVLERHDDIMSVLLPTLGPDRRATYSPFMPISPSTGRVLQVPLVSRDVRAGTVVFRDEDGSLVETPVTGGRVKLQWKPDWAMRWVALGVDYEMAGKDLADSVRLGRRIAEILGGRPPEGFVYELFLDRDGQKISKSRGNGMAIEEWLEVAPQESLAFYLFAKPTAARRLHPEAIPRSVDDYISAVQRIPGQTEAQRLDNPAWHVHGGDPPDALRRIGGITFGTLVNLATTSGAEDAETLMGFVRRHVPDLRGDAEQALARLAAHALAFARRHETADRVPRPATEAEKAAMADLAVRLGNLAPGAGEEDIQAVYYAVGRDAGFELKDWFRSLYEVLLGASSGPRMGVFTSLLGIEETRALLIRAAGAHSLRP